jgi:hypothetical protein
LIHSFFFVRYAPGMEICTSIECFQLKKNLEDLFLLLCCFAICPTNVCSSFLNPPPLVLFLFQFIRYVHKCRKIDEKLIELFICNYDSVVSSSQSFHEMN